MKVQPSLEECKQLMEKECVGVIPISTEIYADTCTPVEVLRILKHVSSHVYLLESAEADKRWGRYSFLGYDPLLEITGYNGTVTIKTPLTTQTTREDICSRIRSIIEENKSPKFDYLPSFTGGLVGYFSYDYIKYSEPTLQLDAVEEIEALAPTHIILSPGPGKPSDAGICEDVIRAFGGKVPILGICLGHQAICEVFGATVTYAKQLMHGKQSVAKLDTDSVLFRGMEQEITVARYHSLAADPDTMPDCLRVTANTCDGEVMAVEHTEYPVYGVQFHPESVLTPEGRQIMENFLRAGDLK